MLGQPVSRAFCSFIVVVGYWTFDGGSVDWRTNTVADMSGQGNTGTLVSMSTTSSPTPGKIGQAMTFDGTNHITSSALSSFCSATACTLSAWAYPIGAAPSSDPFAYAGTGVLGDYEGNFGLYRSDVGAGDQFCGYNWDGNDDHVCVNVITNKWTHLLMVHADGVLSFYVNGALVDSAPSGNTGDMTSPILLGAGDINDFGAAAHFRGKIDDARIYNRALSATEVKQLYNVGR